MDVYSTGHGHVICSVGILRKHHYCLAIETKCDICNVVSCKVWPFLNLEIRFSVKLN